MNEPADWNQLVEKTRKRPLMWFPVAYPSVAGTTVCSNRNERLLFFPAFAIFGFILVWGSLSWIDVVWGRIVAGIVGAFILCVVTHRLLFPRNMFIPNNGNEITIQYGFLLAPTRLVLDRRTTTVDYQTGSETQLHSSLHRFKVILLRHVETQEVVHFGFTIKSDDALRAFDAMAKLLAPGGRNISSAVITLADGSLLKVDRMATWAAGQWTTYRNRLTVQGNAAEINRQAFGENKNVVEGQSNVYPVRIEANVDSVRLFYSNHQQKTVPRNDCVAIQLCKEEIAGRNHTRFEINLIEDAFFGNRVNLMSYDLSPHDLGDEVRQAAEQLGQLLQCDLVDHL